MNFDDIVSNAIELLQRERRVSWRALRRRLELSDDDLEDLKAELIHAKRLAVEGEGGVLVWIGGEPIAPGDFGTHLREESVSPERRQLTVMFSDLVGSTALSQRIDPEDLTDLLHKYYELCATIVRRHEGFLDNYLGDGVLIYFGYPTSRENDAQRAIRAAGELIAELQNLDVLTNLPDGSRLQARVGIHTGLVVVGELAREGHDKLRTVAGETLNIAARLQQQAEPGTVVISGSTRRLVEGFFTLKDLGPRTLKGVSSPVAVYQVIAQTDAESRFQITAESDLPPIVGREAELRTIFDRWEATKEGHGSFLSLKGEPGIGKSRLVAEVKRMIEQEGGSALEFHCSPYNQNTAFYPLTRHLELAFGLQKSDTPEAKMAKITRALAGFDFPTEETPQLSAGMLSVPGATMVDPNPRVQKDRTLKTMLAWMKEEAQRRPICVIWEDLHWADASTLEYLEMLAAILPKVSILALMTFRPDFTLPAWADSEKGAGLSLDRLSAEDVAHIIESVVGGKVLPRDVLSEVVRRTDGIPLFAEELTKMVLESDLMTSDEGTYRLAGSLPPRSIPSTLQDSLMARLDRLGSAKEVAQLASVLGREFSYDVLKAVSDSDDGNLQRRLVQLTDSGLVLEQGGSPDTKYLFKHALIRDAAYDSLLRSTRRKYHLRVAETLEQRFPETIEIQPEILARHLTEANQDGRAISYWQRAGEHAARRSANVEAMKHFNEGLALLDHLPQDNSRDRLEFELYLAYLPVLSVVEGWAAPQARAAYLRTEELCEALDEKSRMSGVYYGLALFHIAGAQHQIAHKYASRVLEIAHDSSQPESLLIANWIVGSTLYFLGRPKQSYELLTEALRYKDAWQEAVLLYGQHPQIECMCFQAQCLWPLGYPDGALRTMHEAMALARQSKVAFNLAYSSCCMLLTRLARREFDAAVASADELIALCVEHNFEYFRRVTVLMRSFALIFLGQADNVDDLTDSLKELLGPEIDSYMYKPYYQINLAECYGLLNRPGEGLKLIDDAIAAIEQTDERWWEPEAWRVKGNLLARLAEKDPSASRPGLHDTRAEEALRGAIDIARGRGAKSHELRATISLSRALAREGRYDEAKLILSDAYNWFEEGFDGPDLKEAKTLLDQLA
jgi:predicted ATPase/class 3 adenylate cyclase